MSSRKHAPPARRRSRRSPGRLPCWLGPSIAVLVVGGGFIALGVFLYTTIQRRWSDIADYLDPGNSFDLSYLPPDADCYIVWRGAALHRAGPVDLFLGSGSYQEGLKPAWELLGLAPENIDTATYGAVGFERQLIRTFEGRAAAPDFVTVIRTVQPVERIAPRNPLVTGEEVRLGDHSYVRVILDASLPLALCVLGPRTILFGSEGQVRASLERLDQEMAPPRRTELDFVNPEQHLLIVALSGAVGEEGAGSAASSSRPYPTGFVDLVDTIDGMPDAYALGLTFESEEIVIEALCQFAGGSQREAFSSRMEQLTATTREQLAAAMAESRTSGGGRGWEAASAGQQALDQLQVSSDADSVTVRTTVPIDQLLRRDLLRVHTLTMTPFNLTLQDAPRLMLGLDVDDGVE